MEYLVKASEDLSESRDICQHTFHKFYGSANGALTLSRFRFGLPITTSKMRISIIDIGLASKLAKTYSLPSLNRR